MTKPQKPFKVRAETRKKMQPVTRSGFYALLDKAALTTPSRKPAPKHS